MTILVTGSAGMIGRHLVKELLGSGHKVVGIDRVDVRFDGDYEHFSIDIGDKKALEGIFSSRAIDRVIHLAALAHTMGGKRYPKSMYEHLNVECANNIFQVSKDNNVPVLFISTVDVFGFQKGIVNKDTICKPVTIYGKTKLEAECLLKDSGVPFDIFRFSPVHTPNQKRDIQKRIYLKYPKWAYQIGRNTEYEVLDVNTAVEEVAKWCLREPTNNITILKDDKLLSTVEYIKNEKALGNAKHVLRIPRWLAVLGYYILRVTGKNKFTFLLNKAIHPLRSTNYVESR